MASRKEEKARLRAERLDREAAERRRAERARRLKLQLGGVLAVVVVGLGVLFALNNSGGSSASTEAKNGGAAGEFKFAVGKPGRGEKAPPVRLQTTSGETFDLRSLRGKRVLLYFQEGLMCQPCWDQIVAIERELPKFKALAIGPIVSITGDPLNLMEQKVADEGIRSPVLSDSGYPVSDAYGARGFGMMGGQMAGHSFILVGKDGRIMWRADYGGSPDYTMFVPTDALLADLRQGLKQTKGMAKQPA